MRILVNTRLLQANKLEGIGWFTHETLKRITTDHPEHEFIFLFDRPYSKRFIYNTNVKPVVMGPPTRHPLLWFLWFEKVMPIALKKQKADLFLSPDGYLSLKTKVPSIPVMHDINFEHYPQDLPWVFRNYYKYYFPKFARFASRIATVSEFSKNDISTHYQVPPEKIDVVYNGANEHYAPIDELRKKSTQDTFTNGSPYFLFVGSLHQRKNIVNMFKAFDLFKKRTDNDVKLLVVGEKKWWTSEMEQTHQQMDYADDVLFTGRMSEELLKMVIPSALAMVYVSYFEGFGIPIVEAMYCDTPVITSNITSMPEVAGDAALLVDPFSEESIADAMQLMATDETLRKDLIVKGQIQKQKFTWQNSADRLWNCIEKTLSEV